jgi:hypothetical protein
VNRRRRLFTAVRNYASYVRSLAPTLWLRFNELSGTIALNSGSLGSTQWVTNGGFDADSGWTKGSGWTIAGGVAHNDGTGGTAVLVQTIPLVSGKSYTLTYTISNYSGSATVTGRFSGGTGTAHSGNGTYTDILTSGNTALSFNPTSGFVGDIDNVTLIADYSGIETSITGNQTGKLLGPTGVGGAVSYNGTTSLLTMPGGLNYSAWTRAWLVKLTGAGESSNGVFYDINAGATELRFDGSAGALRATRAGSTTAASSVTTTGPTLNQWIWLFLTYNNSGDRMLHLYQGVSGTVTEFAYSTQTAMVGTLTTQSAYTAIIGNNAAVSRTMEGLLDEHLWWSRVLTLAEMQRIVQLSGP